ncbi:MAG TPA: tRNA (adenosine(37)-N6)-threonylcarbamoyltransferase complex dimerization subunit type 1 TsaB [Steroidobacteraceae bacterium]|nr:tRNA (adenosine(37)-N6)-threonylcarbamoyltransferase complex dimerization subunit type 1 TsaB [Steroidobacteraceae bacterium]
MQRRSLNILAVDTATEACSAALLCGPDCAFSRYEEPGRGHAERILMLVDEILAESRLTLAALDAIAFGRGPGGFTGVRLATSVAQGLAFGAGLPVVPVSDLRALAQRAFDSAPQARSLIVCADARMREVYWGCFRRNEQGLAEPVSGSAEWGDAERAAERADAEHVSAPDRVALAAGLDEPIHGVGRGFTAYPQLEAKLGPRLRAVHADLLPRALEIARLGAADFAAGIAVDPTRAIPIYLRDEVARPPAGRLASRD